MNTRKDDGPAANDDYDDEMWGNIKNISFDLINDEVNVISATNFKFLFPGKHNPWKYTPRDCTAGYLWPSASQYAFTPKFWSKFSHAKKLLPPSCLKPILLNRPCHWV